MRLCLLQSHPFSPSAVMLSPYMQRCEYGYHVVSKGPRGGAALSSSYLQGVCSYVESKHIISGLCTSFTATQDDCLVLIDL